MAKGKRKAAAGDVATNRRASYRYHLIDRYEAAARENHEAERPRKLLLHRREIERLIGSTAEKGLTIVPTRMYFKGPRAKVEIALARGKDVGDKRRALRDRDQKREIERALAEHARGR